MPTIWPATHPASFYTIDQAGGSGIIELFVVKNQIEAAAWDDTLATEIYVDIALGPVGKWDGANAATYAATLIAGGHLPAYP